MYIVRWYNAGLLTVMASLTPVRVLDGSAVIAEHPRVYGKGEQIEHPAHIEALLSAKRGARHTHLKYRFKSVFANPFSKVHELGTVARLIC